MALKVKNMVGVSATGSGKTLSFLLPSMIHVNAQVSVWMCLKINNKIWDFGTKEMSFISLSSAELKSNATHTSYSCMSAIIFEILTC